MILPNRQAPSPPTAAWSGAAATVSDQREVTRIEAALERHMTHGVGHSAGRDFKHAGGGALKLHVQRLGQPFAQSGFGRTAIRAASRRRESVPAISGRE